MNASNIYRVHSTSRFSEDVEIDDVKQQFISVFTLDKERFIDILAEQNHSHDYAFYFEISL